MDMTLNKVLLIFLLKLFCFHWLQDRKEKRIGKQTKEETEVDNVRGKEIATAPSLGECQTWGRLWKVASTCFPPAPPQTPLLTTLKKWAESQEKINPTSALLKDSLGTSTACSGKEQDFSQEPRIKSHLDFPIPTALCFVPFMDCEHVLTYCSQAHHWLAKSPK